MAKRSKYSHKHWISSKVALQKFLKEYKVSNSNILLSEVVDVEVLDDIMKYAGIVESERKRTLATINRKYPDHHSIDQSTPHTKSTYEKM